MAVFEEIKARFEALNLTLKEEVLNKCCELCISYGIDSEDLIDQWLAYAASNLSGDPPSLEALDKMERKELQKQSKTVPKTPKTSKSKPVDVQISTPPQRRNLQNENTYQSPKVSEPVYDTPSKQFAQRSDARSIQNEWGNPTEFKNRSTNPFLIKILNEEIKDCKYMYEKFLTRQQSLNNMSLYVIGEITNYYQLELSQEKIKDYSGEMVISGRVYSESSGKTNVQSILLEGTLEIYKGQIIKLNVDNLDRLALFSGQVVVIKGNNLKNRFMVNEIYTGTPLPLPEKEIQLEESLQIVVASGPFTLPDNLLYEPLEDLLKYVVEFKPNLLILMGPFIEAVHPILETANESYDIFFENIVETIMEKLQGIAIQVILIPSHKDFHNHVIFPSMPYKIRRKYENLILVPNPCILDIEGLIIGASTADILFHISKSEVFKDSSRKDGMDRMSRLASHVLQQRCFYPLHPPDLDIRVDYQLLDKYGMLELSPHLLFLPSNLRHFIKKIGHCLVINPERISKGTVAGTFARVEIKPGIGPINERTSCQILRV